MADNPVSWFFLSAIGIYFTYRFLKRIVDENERIKVEREKACQEIFLETPIDKRNIMAYNRYINKGGNTNEHYDARLRND